MDKLLTISIASYNVEDTLARTLDSLIIQEDLFKYLDIIVVDDGSSDGTAALARKYADKYPDSISLLSKENGGYGSTITASLAIAKGRYFKIVDGDDMVIGDNLEALLEILSTCDIDLVISPFELLHMGTEERKYVDRHPNLSETCEKIENANFEDGLAIFEICINTERLKACLDSYTEHCFYTDNELVMAVIMSADTVASFKRAISVYSTGINGQSMSVQGLRKHCLDTIKVSESIFEIYERASADMHGSRKMLAERLVCSMVRLVYISMMVHEQPSKYKDTLKSFDAWLRRSHPKVYELSNESRIVRLTRKTGPLGFLVLSSLVRRKEERETQW